MNTQNIKPCPLFGKCGGCKLDFAAPDYQDKKLSFLKQATVTNEPIWLDIGNRRRADMAFVDGTIGFFAPHSHDVIPVKNCPLLTPGLNKILPDLSKLNWTGGGSLLITECDNGIDIAITAAAPYFPAEFGKSASKLSPIRITWNDKNVKQLVEPIIKFENIYVKYPSGEFLQLSKIGEETILNLIKKHIQPDGKKIVDLFCGVGTFTLPLGADGFDIETNMNTRDLFKKPLSSGELKRYDAIVLDPPRIGADKQSIQIAKLPSVADSKAKTVVYVSCNPDTFARDSKILIKGGWKLTDLTPIDQFVGSSHWELIGKFEK